MSAPQQGGPAGPGEQYNPGAPTTPRQAATVILLRGGADALEVLLVRRSPRARFMGGVWVFPGGAVDADALVKFSRWITPAQVKIRFDTHFFLAPLPPGQEASIDGKECVDVGWFA